MMPGVQFNFFTQLNPSCSLSDTERNIACMSLLSQFHLEIAGDCKLSVLFAFVLQDLPDLSKMWGPDGPPGPFTSSVAHVPKLKLTVYKDREQLIPVKEVGKLSLPDFARLYTVS